MVMRYGQEMREEGGEGGVKAQEWPARKQTKSNSEESEEQGKQIMGSGISTTFLWNAIL
jgi:hypothetical protein